jgi:hypothetical protein
LVFDFFFSLFFFFCFCLFGFFFFFLLLEKNETKKKKKKERKKIRATRLHTLNEALLDAASRGDTDKVDELISQGALVEYRDDEGRTALFIAAREGHAETCAALIDDHGADVDASRFNGATPLHVAAHWGHQRVCKVLVERKAHINAELFTNGDRPVGMALRQKHHATAKYLARVGGLLASEESGCVLVHGAQAASAMVFGLWESWCQQTSGSGAVSRALTRAPRGGPVMMMK